MDRFGGSRVRFLIQYVTQSEISLDIFYPIPTATDELIKVTFQDPVLSLSWRMSR